MRLLGRGQPDVTKLQRDSDVAGLLVALRYGDLVVDGNGGHRDRGAPIRLKAVEVLSDTYQELADFYGSDVADGLTDRSAIADGLTEALADADPGVRAAAVDGLEKIGAPSLEALLDGLVSWKAPPYQEAIRRALGVLTRSSAEGLPEGLIDRLIVADSQTVQDWQADALRALVSADSRGDATWAHVADHAIAQMERAGDASRRTRVERVLGWLGPAAADSVIAALAQGRGDPALLRAAGDIRDGRAVDPMIRLLDSSDPEVRSCAAIALGKVRDTRAVAPLLDATQDPELRVREAASEALDGMGLAAVIFGLANLGDAGADGELPQSAMWALRAAARHLHRDD